MLMPVGCVFGVETNELIKSNQSNYFINYLIISDYSNRTSNLPQTNDFWYLMVINSLL